MKPAKKKLLTFKQFRQRQKQLTQGHSATEFISQQGPNSVGVTPNEIHIGGQQVIESRKR